MWLADKEARVSATHVDLKYHAKDSTRIISRDDAFSTAVKISLNLSLGNTGGSLTNSGHVSRRRKNIAAAVPNDISHETKGSRQAINK